MTEKRFNANGVACVMIWKRKKDGTSVPYFRIYEPRDPVTGWAKKKPDGSPPDFKDYEIRTMTDPSVVINDKYFEFVEREDGEKFFDFSLETLGKKPSSNKEDQHES